MTQRQSLGIRTTLLYNSNNSTLQGCSTEDSAAARPAIDGMNHQGERMSVDQIPHNALSARFHQKQRQTKVTTLERN